MEQLIHLAQINHLLAQHRPNIPTFIYDKQALITLAAKFIKTFTNNLYAMKANNNTTVLKQLYALGITSFDTASLAEIIQIKHLFPHANCYFMNAIKDSAEIKIAYENYGVCDYSVDSIDEINKIISVVGQENANNIRLFIRAKPLPHATAVYDFSCKFGCEHQDLVNLICYAKQLGFRAAMSFHNGSQCLDPLSYNNTLTALHNALAQLPNNIELEVLNIGGGFPCDYVDSNTGKQRPLVNIDKFITIIKDHIVSLDKFKGLPIFSEVGRAIVAPCMHLVVKVIARKGDAIYLNDGIYGNLWELATGDIVPQTYVISQQQGALLERAKEKRAFTIYGPTCDNVDVLPHRWFLNQDITTGDYIILQNMGAYSFVSTTSFNGFGGYDILSLH